MGKRKRKKISSTLTWKTIRGFFRLLSQGVVKAGPLLFFLLAILGIFWGIRENLYADPAFLVESIEVIPDGALSPGTIQALEKRYLRQNLFQLSVREVSHALEENPRIRDAHVRRQFPTTLRIEVIERRPLFQIQFFPKGTYYSVSDDGVLLDADSVRNRDLLLVEAFEAKGVKPEIGKRVTPPGLEEGMALVGAFREHSWGQTEILEKMTLDHLGNVSLVLGDGVQLRFGRHPMKRLQTLEAVTGLLQGPERKRILYIDLQYQDLIVRKRN